VGLQKSDGTAELVNEGVFSRLMADTAVQATCNHFWDKSERCDLQQRKAEQRAMSERRLLPVKGGKKC
jgi:hypothetical protein